MRNYFFILLVITISLTSCKESNETGTYKPVSMGTQGQVLVVMNTNLWNGKLGELVKKRIASEILYYPQIEYLFDLSQASVSGFNKTTKRYKNILQLEVNTHEGVEPGVSYLTDVWASDQVFIKVIGNSQQELAQVFVDNAQSIQDYLMEKELSRQKSQIVKNKSKSIEEKLIKNYHVSLTVPSDMSLSLEDSSFFVLERKRLRSSDGTSGDIQQYILVYSYPYTDDSTFTKAYQIAKRDSVVKKYFTGVNEDSYMITAPDSLAPSFEREKLYKGIYAYELRGLYSMVNDFRGGPFISMSIVDEKRKRIVTIEGNLFAPKFNKREFMMELETIMNTLSLQ